ncbi:glycosyltransferase family 9 protein [Campylobacter sp. RM15925]|uniref:glycosyltransferase family 9 protein n=1 Tax=Campylobacter sp. RM15925 TaxID=1705724 RepID=UPI001475688A|nr:glycosyltransferase family 9 protein [Campylobacter sp. RM15925]
MLYFVIYIVFLPLLFILSFFRRKSTKFLVIQTAKIGDYANSSVIFENLKEFDIVLDKINLSFANYDERIKAKFAINDYKKSLFSKLKLAFLLFFKNYEQIYILMPNDLNLFLAKFAFAKNCTTIKHYNRHTSSDFLSLNMKLINHTLNDLTIDTYLKMIDLQDHSKICKKEIQKPLFVPQNSIIENNDKFKIGISLTAGNKIKTIPPKTLNELFRAIDKFECEIYVFGLKNEEKLMHDLIFPHNAKVISLLDKIALCELPFYISKMDLYISSDTGNSYIADTMEVATINFIGPCYAKEQRPIYEKSLIIESGLKPFSSVFKTDTKTNADEYFKLTAGQITKILDFINSLIKDKKQS